MATRTARVMLVRARWLEPAISAVAVGLVLASRCGLRPTDAFVARLAGRLARRGTRLVRVVGR